MPNLNNWIEAQLKRGRTKQQIKSFLIRKGYPQTAVAEVDKIAYTVPSAKTLQSKKIPKKVSSKTITLISIFVGIIFLIWMFNALPFFSKQSSEDAAAGQESAEQIKQEEESKINDEDSRRLQALEARGELSVSETPSDDLCKDFPKVNGEFSCEDAIELALEKYHGEVYTINKINISKLANGQALQKEVWVIEIGLEKSIKTPSGEEDANIEVTVDLINKKMDIYKI